MYFSELNEATFQKNVEMDIKMNQMIVINDLLKQRHLLVTT